ncbi:MAG: MATE family efflux transporter [Bacillota bacterium]|nr:MATE family efflux transporter [Bacillota bacterium]
MRNRDELANQDIKKLLLRYTTPAMIGVLVAALYNIVDRIYVGQLGALEMTGIGISMPLMQILLGFGMLIGIGAGARVSIRLGEGRQQDAESVLGNAFVLLILIPGAISIIGLLFRDSLLYRFGADETTIGFARDYLTIILYGSIFQGIGFGLNTVVRGEGFPKLAMYTQLLGAVTNIVLDPILIYGLGLGIRGAAIATVISQFLSALWIIYHFTRGPGVLRLTKESLRLRFHTILSIVSIGMSPFLMQLASSLITVTMNNALKATGGQIAISAMTAIQAVALFSLMPLFGINQGSQPIIGYNYGAANYKRVREATKYGVLIATAVSTFFFLAVQLFPQTILGLFSSEPEFLQVAIPGARLVFLFLPLVGFQVFSANYFQATGKAIVSGLLSLLRQVIVMLPLLLILPSMIGLNGVWWALPLSDIVASAITALVMILEWKRLKRLEVHVV